jgi:hypothetical protein
MRRILPSCSLLLALLPIASHADTTDLFTITGDSNVYTFTLPQVFTFADQLHLVALPTQTATGTVDGVGGHTFDVTFLTDIGSSGDSLTFNGVTLSGPVLVSLIGQSGTPGNLIDTAEITGVGHYRLINLQNSSFNEPDYFALTIDQETTPAPEPSTLTLLATGILSLLLLPIRKSGRAVDI